MLKSKSAQKGFTIVELLIVIVVIGILAALVLNTFAGVQKRARDTKRQNSINSLSTQLEAYYTNYGSYPSAGVLASNNGLTSDTWITGNLKGFDINATKAPGKTYTSPANSISASTSADKDTFGYVTTPASCASPTDSTGAAATGTACTGFVLSWYSEDKGAVQTKSSLNQ